MPCGQSRQAGLHLGDDGDQPERQAHRQSYRHHNPPDIVIIFLFLFSLPWWERVRVRGKHSKLTHYPIHLRVITNVFYVYNSLYSVNPMLDSSLISYTVLQNTVQFTL